MSSRLPFHEQVKAARKAQHLTQTALGDKIGCGQSAISNYENGNTSALSDELIDLLAQVLGLERSGDEHSQLDDFTREKPGAIAFCGNADCPGAWHEVVNGKQVIYPPFFEITSGLNMTHCPDCRTELEVECRICLTPLVGNSGFCTGCGTALVAPTVKSGDPEEFVARMQARHDRYSTARNRIRKLPASRLVNRPKK